MKKNKITRLSSYRINKITMEDKHEMYKRALTRMEEKALSKTLTGSTQEKVIKVAHLCIQYVNTIPKEINESNIEYLEAVIFMAKSMLKMMSYKTLKQTFPIEKRYAKLDVDWKDYYYTVEEFKDWDENEQIGERVDDILWDYQNESLFRFNVNCMLIMSAKLRMAGKPSIGEMWAKEFKIPTYTQEKDGTLKQHWHKPDLTIVE